MKRTIIFFVAAAVVAVSVSGCSASFKVNHRLHFSGNGSSESTAVAAGSNSTAVAAGSHSSAQNGTSRSASLPSFEDADWNWTEVDGGASVGYAQISMFNSVQSIAVLRYKEGTLHMDVINEPESASDSTSAMAARHGAIAAVNGSYFNMRALTPVTYVLVDGKQEGITTVGEQFRVEGVVAMDSSRVDIFACTPAAYTAVTSEYSDAIAAGPMLLAGGEPLRTEWPADEFCDVRHPRTLVGKTADGEVYMIVVDGRSRGNAAGMTIPECIELCQKFGIVDALNLDGGGSSALWTSETGVVNHPTDNHRFDHFGQRIVPNVVILTKYVFAG